MDAPKDMMSQLNALKFEADIVNKDRTNAMQELGRLKESLRGLRAIEDFSSQQRANEAN